MRRATLEDGRKLCYALMTARRRTPRRLTGASWRVAGCILELSRVGRDTSSVDEISRVLKVSHKVTRSGLDRIVAAEIVTAIKLPDRIIRFEINWALLDAVTEEGDREMAEYWRQREADGDTWDYPDGDVPEAG